MKLFVYLRLLIHACVVHVVYPWCTHGVRVVYILLHSHWIYCFSSIVAVVTLFVCVAMVTVWPPVPGAGGAPGHAAAGPNVPFSPRGRPTPAEEPPAQYTLPAPPVWSLQGMCGQSEVCVVSGHSKVRVVSLRCVWSLQGTCGQSEVCVVSMRHVWSV